MQTSVKRILTRKSMIKIGDHPNIKMIAWEKGTGEDENAAREYEIFVDHPEDQDPEEIVTDAIDKRCCEIDFTLTRLQAQKVIQAIEEKAKGGFYADLAENLKKQYTGQ